MPGNLGLWCAQNLHKVTDADLLLLSHKVEQPETGGIAERLKKPWQVKLLGTSHA
jgi:hypothetical protein